MIGYALHPPWSPTRGRYVETDLQFPAPKLHTHHTRRAQFQSNSDHLRFTTRGIKHDFSFINIRKVPREVLKTEGESRGFQPSRGTLRLLINDKIMF